MYQKLFIQGAVFASFVALPFSVHAGITGTVDVKLQISSGCEVGGAKVEGNMNKFGELDFGRQASTWSNVLTAEVQATGQQGHLEVKCDEGVSGFSVAINGGARGDRTLKESTGKGGEEEPGIEDKNDMRQDTGSLGLGGNMVAYNLYQDATRETEYAIDEPVKFTYKGESVQVPIYGAIAPSQGKPKVAGMYTDMLLVSVTF